MSEWIVREGKRSGGIYPSKRYEKIQELVRCKECAKRMREDCPMCNGCKLDRVPTEDDDYCSYGERGGE